MSHHNSNRKWKIFSGIVWGFAIITAAPPLIMVGTDTFQIILTNLFGWKPAPLDPTSDSNLCDLCDLSGLDGLSFYGYLLLWLLSFSISMNLSVAYRILAEKFTPTSTIQAIIPVAINLAILFLIMMPKY